MHQNQSPAIACTLSTDQQQRCAQAYRLGLFSHVEEVRERDDGYSLRFSWHADRVRQLGEFLAIESSCCSFLDHSVEIPRGKQHVWLHLAGPDEARVVLQEELQQLLPSHRIPQVFGPVVEKTADAVNKTRVTWTRAGLSSIGVAAALCCLAPAIGLSTIAVGSAWFVDATLASILTTVVGAVAFAGWKYTRGKSRRRSKCC